LKISMRHMRREDREITDCLEIESILHKTNVAELD